MKIIYLILDAISYEDSWLSNKNFMPNLKYFSLKAKNFHNHFSVTHNTRGNLASIFYGASPSLTKVMGRKQSFRDCSLKTLQKILGENNYFTSYIGTQPLFQNEKPNDDLDFTECIYLSPSMSDFYINAENFNNYLYKKIEYIKDNSLLFIHYTDCHEPYETPDNKLDKKEFPNIYKFHHRISNLLYRIPIKILKNYFHPNSIIKKYKTFKKYPDLKKLCTHPFGPISNPERYSGFYETAWENKSFYEEYKKMMNITLKYQDKQLANILNFIKEKHAKDTLIFISSDHGNNGTLSPKYLKEYGRLSDKSTHIPLTILSFDHNLSNKLKLNYDFYTPTSHTNFRNTILSLINYKNFQFYNNSLFDEGLNNEFVLSEVNDERFDHGECVLRNNNKKINLRILKSDDPNTLMLIKKEDVLNNISDHDYDLYRNFKSKYNLSIN